MKYYVQICVYFVLPHLPFIGSVTIDFNSIGYIGESTVLQCQDTPPITAVSAYWYRGGSLMDISSSRYTQTKTPTGFNLTISSLVTSDGGVYYCGIDFEISTSKSLSTYYNTKAVTVTNLYPHAMEITFIAFPDPVYVATVKQDGVQLDVYWNIYKSIHASGAIMLLLRSSTVFTNQAKVYTVQVKILSPVSLDVEVNITWVSDLTTQSISVLTTQRISPVAKVSIAPNNTITEGDGPVTVQCSASSKPLSYFTVRKDGLTTVISEGQGNQHNHHDYIIPKINRTNAGIYSCTASNGVVGPRNEEEATAELVVQYPPDVHIYGRNVTTSDVHARLVCVPHGVPDKYTFGTWKHLWPGYNGTLRNLKSTYIEEHNATLDLNNISYHDSGVYVCQTSNGVKSAGTQEDVITQLLYVLVKAPPVIFKIPNNVSGGIGSIIAIQLEYYSNTDSGHVTIQHSNSNKAYKGDSAEEIKINNLPLYTHYCPAKVYRINFNISINNQEDFGHYKVDVTNNIGKAEATLEIKPDSEPGQPYKLDSYNSQKNQITLSWYPGFHGGFDQTFVIQNSMDKIVWQNASLVPGGKNEDLFNAIITKLKPNTIYYFRIYAFNVKGNGELADSVISVKTLSDLDVHQHTGPQNSTIIGGAVGGGVAVLAIIVVLILLLRRRILLSGQNMARKHTQRSLMPEGAKMEECTTQNTVDIPEETNESVNIRSSDTITYEALHPYANVKDNTYSAINLSPHQKGEERVYENTTISECH